MSFAYGEAVIHPPSSPSVRHQTRGYQQRRPQRGLRGRDAIKLVANLILSLLM
jgi:hypothetical protein